MPQSRALTKSLFQIAKSCPRKLIYAANNFPSRKTIDFQEQMLEEFLVEQGRRVERYTRVTCFPDGVNVQSGDEQFLPNKARRKSDAILVNETKERLLKNDKISIFQGAVAFKSFIVYPDIIQKVRANEIHLIEVVSKSWDSRRSREEQLFSKRSRDISSSFLPHIQDAAFCKYVIENAFPSFKVLTWLMLPDKSKVNTTNINMNLILESGENSPCDNQCLVTQVNVDDLVQRVLNQDEIQYPGYDKSSDGNEKSAVSPFVQAISLWADTLRNAKKSSSGDQAPPIGSHCKDCEYRIHKGDDGTGHIVARISQNISNTRQDKSGFETCWSQATRKHTVEDKKTVAHLWYGGKTTNKLICQGKYWLSDITSSDLGLDKDDKHKKATLGMSRAQRQWFQIKLDAETGKFALEKDYLLREMDKWKYPLNFIDFETIAPALPYTTGRSPFDMLAFQFSHHILREPGGSVEHASEFLHIVPGECPNSRFLEALANSLGHCDGTIFRWSAHENTVLKHLLQQQTLEPSVRTDCSKFIQTLTTGGERELVDLMLIAQRGYYVSGCGGSSSLKRLLVPTLEASERLRLIYSRPTYNSANFSQMTWWRPDPLTNGPIDPYNLLKEADDIQVVSNGGHAIVVYDAIQNRMVNSTEQNQLQISLKKYCELDTLAMAMLVQAWNEFLQV